MIACAAAGPAAYNISSQPTRLWSLARGAGRVVAPRMPYAVEPAVAALAGVRHIVLLGAKPPVAFFAYPDKPRKIAPADCSFLPLADQEHDLHAVLAALADELGARAVPPAGIAERKHIEPSALPVGKTNSEGIAAVLTALLPEHAIVVDEAVTTGRSFGPPTAGAAPHDWLSVMGGAIGFALPSAVGAAVAAPDRKVVALEGDGSAMYTIQALWTMAREGLDVTIRMGGPQVNGLQLLAAEALPPMRRRSKDRRNLGSTRLRRFLASSRLVRAGSRFGPAPATTLTASLPRKTAASSRRKTRTAP